MSDRDTEALRALAGTIRNAAADPSSPWYGSDLVEVMAEAAAVVEEHAKLREAARPFACSRYHSDLCEGCRLAAVLAEGKPR